MNHCEKFQKFIELYIEGQLNPTQQTQLDQHIQDCRTCRDEFQDAQKISIIIEECFQPKIHADHATDSILTTISKKSTRDQRYFNFRTFSKAAAGIMLAAALLISFYAGRTSNQWKPGSLTKSAYAVKQLEGTVLVKHANSQSWRPLTSDTAIYVDDQFITSPGSTVTFAVNERSHIELKENSMLIFDITPDKTNLHLVHGILDADLASPHGPFFVTTPHGQAEALGTEFTVKVD